MRQNHQGKTNSQRSTNIIAPNVSKVTPSSPNQNSLQYINADVFWLSLKLLAGRETKQRLVFFLKPILLSWKSSNYSLFCSWIFNSILVSLSGNKLIKMSLIVIYSKFSIFYVPPPCHHCRPPPNPEFIKPHRPLASPLFLFFKDSSVYACKKWMQGVRVHLKQCVRHFF